jgi:hypothetical protein
LYERLSECGEPLSTSIYRKNQGVGWHLEIPKCPYFMSHMKGKKGRQVELHGGAPLGWLITHKYRGSIVTFSINKSVEPNEELKVELIFPSSSIDHRYNSTRT